MAISHQLADKSKSGFKIGHPARLNRLRWSKQASSGLKPESLDTELILISRLLISTS